MFLVLLYKYVLLAIVICFWLMLTGWMPRWERHSNLVILHFMRLGELFCIVFFFFFFFFFVFFFFFFFFFINYMYL